MVTLDETHVFIHTFEYQSINIQTILKQMKMPYVLFLVDCKKPKINSREKNSVAIKIVIA